MTGKQWPAGQMKKDQTFTRSKLMDTLFLYYELMIYTRCESGTCETGKLPSQEICENFFKSVGGKQHFLKEGLSGAKINIDGKQHECSTHEGPGEFGWCRVRCLKEAS